MTLVWRKTGELLHAAADLLALLGCEPFDGLRSVEQALPALGRHAVELGETIAHTLLDGRGKLTEAGLVLKGTLLIEGRKLAVAAHPLGEVLLAGAMADAIPWPRWLFLVRAVSATVRGRWCAVATSLRRRDGRSGRERPGEQRCRHNEAGWGRGRHVDERLKSEQ